MSDKVQNNKIKFRSRARLLQQLGDQLIRNEQIALVELVKNAYDADAESVRVLMTDINDRAKGKIVIEDDGIGMDRDLIENVWLEIGSDFKEKQLEEKRTTTKFKRLPIGEKGIGRFGVHKLGNRIRMTTRRENCKETILDIDWNRIKDVRYLEELPIDLVEHEKPSVFLGKRTGTRIEILDLRTSWEKSTLIETCHAINSLQSPFEGNETFKIELQVLIEGQRPEYLEDVESWESIKRHALYHAAIEIDGNRIEKFRYDFLPLPGMDKMKPVSITEKDEKRIGSLKLDDNVDLSNFKIGKIRFEAYVFSREVAILKLGTILPKTVKGYLDEHCGVRVFCDGMRVYDYGEPGNDWLELDIKRVNNPGEKISNNLIIGAVHLDRSTSLDLIEKTNREGFVENPAYQAFKGAVECAVDRLACQIIMKRTDIRRLYGSTKINEPVLADIAELKKYAEKNIKEKDVRKKVSIYLKRIADEYSNVNKVLLQSAGAGLTMSVVVHEVDKLIKSLKVGLQKEKVSEDILVLVKNLALLIQGYSSLISRSPIKEESLNSLIEKSLDICRFRFLAHKIKIIEDFRGADGFDSTILCSRNFFMSAFVNILDNSIWWLGCDGDSNDKKIFVTVSSKLKGYTTVIIADNGPGIKLPTEKITEPFVSGKPGGTGLGLHITKEIMAMHEGLLIFPEEGDALYPDTIRTGAVVALAFKNSKQNK